LSRRTDRVSGLLREEISRLMIEQLNDPRLTGLVTIARAEVSADLQHATIAITVIGDEQQRDDALQALRAASGFLRKSLGQRLSMKRTPALRFELDEIIKRGDNVLALLDSLRTDTPQSEGIDEDG
jgi:ribosome-binding factor A